jgi:hypothetical protein
MAVFSVTGANGTALCENLLCKDDLYYLFFNSGCGRPLAICPKCRVMYILNAILTHSGDLLLDYLDYKLDPDHRTWEWVRIERYCLKDCA